MPYHSTVLDELHALRDVNMRLRAALCDARDKLTLYREAHSGEYVGGVEYTELMLRITAALNQR